MNVDGAVSILRWWQEAGVDTLVAETPRDWLAPEKVATVRLPRSDPHPAASQPSLSRERERVRVRELPDTLSEFQDWLLTGDVPLATPGAVRVGALGNPSSGLMVLVDMPSSEDVGAGHLLSGEPGALFDKMMSAIGRSRETLYLASLSPVRTPTGRFDAAAAADLAEIARRHIALVAPKALLLFGEACAKTLLGGTVAQLRAGAQLLDTTAGPIRTFVTIRPEKLVNKPGLKRLAWEDLQKLREEL